MMDHLTIRPLIRRVESSESEPESEFDSELESVSGNEVHYFAATSRTFEIDPQTDQVIGIALTRKKAQIEPHRSWEGFCDAVGLSSVQVLWTGEMAAFPEAKEPDDEPRSTIDERVYDVGDSGDLLSEMPKLVGDEIRARRRRRGWTQVELAEQIDVSPMSISDWENGQSVPTMVNLEKLADTLTPHSG